MSNCPICKKTISPSIYMKKDGVDFFECESCTSIYADPEFIGQIDSGVVVNYSSQYWKDELASSKARSYGSTLVRFAELFIYSRVEIKKILDIGAGPGFFLDACLELLPELSKNIYGVELFPPPIHTNSSNYIIGGLSDLSQKYETGICIEVIEHLTPNMLDGLARDLAKVASTGALFYFNSANPIFVKNEGGAYLDPKIRGHIVSYSIEGLKTIFEKYGFKVISIPGRDYGFLVEFLSPDTKFITIEERINNPLQVNINFLRSDKFGEMFYSMGVESARCYQLQALLSERTHWALSLAKKLSDMGL